MTLLVRNEADILATNIEYHLRRGVDFFIATDNLSADGTQDVLEHYRRRKILHLILESDDNYAQSRWVTRMARMAAVEYQADWVINNDADEFWWPEASNDLKELLADVPPEIDALSVSRCNFVPVAHAETSRFFDAMTFRERVARNALGESLPPKTCHRGYPDVDVAMGNHAASRPDRPMNVGHAPLTILHFPLRSYDQFCRKISLGGAALARNAELDPAMVGTWRMLYQKWQRGDLEAYYRDQQVSTKELDSAIASQRLIRDERLRDFIRRSDSVE